MCVCVLCILYTHTQRHQSLKISCERAYDDGKFVQFRWRCVRVLRMRKHEKKLHAQVAVAAAAAALQM